MKRSSRFIPTSRLERYDLVGYLHYGLAPYWDTSLSSEEQIKGLAYAIWEREGRPTGRDAEHYFRAERILSVQGVIGSQNSGDTKN